MQHTPAQSFGIIPLYKDYNGYKVLLVQNSNGQHWGFPKGTPEAGETPLETATRELHEETGIAPDSIRIQPDPIFTEQYSFERDGTTYDKTNTYYVGFVDAMNIGAHLDDISDMRWLPVSEAKELLTFKQSKEVANQLRDYVESLDEYNW